MYYNLDKEITLSELIKELQSLEKEHGMDKVLGVSATSGMIEDMARPHTIMMVTPNSQRARAFIASMNEDIGKSVVVDD